MDAASLLTGHQHHPPSAQELQQSTAPVLTDEDHLTAEEAVVMMEERPRPVLQRKKLERIVRKGDPVMALDWLNISPRMGALEEVVVGGGEGEEDEEYEVEGGEEEEWDEEEGPEKGQQGEE